MLEHIEVGIWNFCSKFDLFFLGFGTMFLGTFDGRHVPAAGVRGFKLARASGRDCEIGQRFHQQPFVGTMFRSWNYGGHFGWTNRVFVAEWLAPLLRNECERG